MLKRKLSSLIVVSLFSTALSSLAHAQVEETLAGTIPVIKRDTENKKWKVRFYFGPTRTTYLPTNVNLISSKVNVVIKDFSFAERTSQDAYEPDKWRSLQNLFQWIDEPTNTMILEFQRGKNVFFINVYHPKFLTTPDNGQENYGNVEGEIEGTYINKPLNIKDNGLNNSKELGLKLQNTHRQMDWQLGYGRRIDLVRFKGGKVVITPNIAVGITTGKTQSSYRDRDGNVSDYESSGEVQGANLTLAGRMTYERGRWSFFLDERLTLSQLRHPFLDGYTYYDMRYIMNTLGIAFQLNRR